MAHASGALLNPLVVICFRIVQGHIFIYNFQCSEMVNQWFKIIYIYICMYICIYNSFWKASITFLCFVSYFFVLHHLFYINSVVKSLINYGINRTNCFNLSSETFLVLCSVNESDSMICANIYVHISALSWYVDVHDIVRSRYITCLHRGLTISLT